VSSEGIVADSVIGLVSEPVWKWSVLSLLLSKTLLYQQAFLGSHYSNYYY